ncbi:Zinc finger protein 862 [Merluccius polli]|uniref:Zinc finger protein 862 n=1 Tax=Merluccius polli TaxID=89951 RepID=A0AA47M7L3_MERPO|nr:Zinc finger protein 862 [Merluccius polli]KAK0144721.1 Zinc finger protein 862 [Merluccius polli]
MKLETIVFHENSQSHKDCLIAEEKVSEPLQQAPCVISLVKLPEATKEKMAILFRTSHAIAKNARPFSDFKWMCNLDEKKGLKVGKTYRNEVECRLFTKYIAKAEQIKLREELEETKFCSILSDGSTDTAVKEEELVYVRFCTKGNVNVKFIGIEAVEKADSANITQAIKNQMDAACKGWEGKLVACVTDGAAVMSGGKSGVVTRLKGDKTYVIGVHCMAHRLELSFSDAIKESAMFRRMDELLGGLYSFYHKSPLNRANLIKSYATLKAKPLMPTRIGGTRWVGHLLRALDHYLRGYPAIVLHLEQIQSPDAQGVRSVPQAKAKKFHSLAKESALLQFCGFLFDVLSHLSSLSATLQKPTITLAEAHASLLATQAVLDKYETRAGPMMKATSGLTFEGVKLSVGKNDDRAVKTAGQTLLSRLRDSLNDRFQDVSEGVLRATMLASFKNWTDRESVETDFGDREIEALCQHFGPVLTSAGVCVEKIPDQWTILKSRIYAQTQTVQTTSWSKVNQRDREQCPDVLDLIDLVLAVPASTADCERGFSTMKQVKTDWRSNLTSSSLSDLMTIQLCSPDVNDFDPSTAIHLWHSDTVRSRRPDYVPEDQEDQDGCVLTGLSDED